MKRNRVFYLQREHLRVEREEKEGVVVVGVSQFLSKQKFKIFRKRNQLRRLGQTSSLDQITKRNVCSCLKIEEVHFEDYFFLPN